MHIVDKDGLVFDFKIRVRAWIWMYQNMSLGNSLETLVEKLGITIEEARYILRDDKEVWKEVERTA
jgi:hypothetical protein